MISPTIAAVCVAIVIGCVALVLVLAVVAVILLARWRID